MKIKSIKLYCYRDECTYKMYENLVILLFNINYMLLFITACGMNKICIKVW